MAQCRKCGANPQKENVCLRRVNPIGENGVWECNPKCNSDLLPDELVLLSIDGESEICSSN